MAAAPPRTLDAPSADGDSSALGGGSAMVLTHAKNAVKLGLLKKNEGRTLSQARASVAYEREVQSSD